jgi:pilus assembly protein CpaB
MSSRKLSLLLAASVIALGTFFAVRNIVQPETADIQQMHPAVNITEVAVVTRDLPTGSILKESDVKWTEWAASADTSTMVVKGKAELSSLTGAVVRNGFRLGDPILSSYIAHAHDQGFLAAVLTPGMRAMSISLSPMSQVAGFIFPGDRVDVILSHSFSRKDSNSLTERRISETILQNVRVLALDQRSDNQSTDPKVAQLATLEVNEKDAEKLALAIDMTSNQSGNKAMITLVLRSLAIVEPVASTPPAPQAEEKQNPTWDSDVSRSYPVVNGDDALMQRVQIMRGKTTTETTFERHR